MLLQENIAVVDAETPGNPKFDFPEEPEYHVDSSLSEADNESSRHICSSIKSNDRKDGMEKPT